MSFKIDALDKMAALIAAAFGLVAALAWNGAILAVFQQMFGSQDSVPAMVSYAIVVTVIAVIVTIAIAKLLSRAKAEEERKAKRRK